MESAWRQVCLLVALLGTPLAFASFCVGISRHQQGRLVSYLAYYFLFGFLGQWLLTAALWPSGLGRTLLGFLLTVTPVACLALALTLQKGPRRRAFDTGAMVGCYLYVALIAVGVAMAQLGASG